MQHSVREMMTTKDVTIEQTATIADAAKLMKQHDVGFLPVTDRGRLCGVVTDRDLVLRGYAAELDANQPISKVFTKEVISCSQDTSADEAAKVMANHRIRRLLITDNERLIGIVTLADLARRDEADQAAGRALSEITAR